MTRLLKAVYPEHQWEFYKFSKPHHVTKGKTYFSKTQQLLFQQLKTVSTSHTNINSILCAFAYCNISFQQNIWNLIVSVY